jgi:hypothetical protein
MHRKYSTRPIVTIAYVSEMSSSSDIIPAEVERLQGIAARQSLQLGGTSTDPLVRIIFGNAGTGMAHGPLLAQMLAEMAENDPSIVGVVGLALNSAATADTIKALGADGLPMIAVTPRIMSPKIAALLPGQPAEPA